MQERRIDKAQGEVRALRRQLRADFEEKGAEHRQLALLAARQASLVLQLQTEASEATLLRYELDEHKARGREQAALLAFGGGRNRS
eukprot:SAG22_NODE_3549_length_1649_cov_3.500000_2_plen_86_part_00